MKSIKLKTFNSEIQGIKIMSKKLSKYIAAFDYFDKIFTSVIGVPVGIAC